MFRLDDLQLFVRAAVLNSFTLAAREIDLHPAKVSVAIKRLEKSLDIRLFARTTRNIRLTSEGKIWLPYARQMLNAMNLGLQKIQPTKSSISGLLQIAAPSDLGRNFLFPFLDDLMQQYPELSLRITLSDEEFDVFKEPIDVAFRYGESTEDASFISLPVSPNNRRVLVASPSWVEINGDPECLEDLINMQTLAFSFHGKIFDNWSFTLDGVKKKIKVKSSIISNNAEVIRQFALSGQGITYHSWIDVYDDVQAGRLKVILPKLIGDHLPLNMIIPHRKQISLSVRVICELLQIKCKEINDLYVNEIKT